MSLPSLRSRFAAAPPFVRPLLVAGAGAAALLLAFSSDATASAAGRASLLLLALAFLAWKARRSPAAAATALIRVEERRALSRSAAVALLSVDGRSLVVGYGAEGVRLLADLGPSSAGDAP